MTVYPVRPISAAHDRARIFMQQVRQFELGLIERAQELRCPVHLCIGQEAVPAGLHQSLNPSDWLFSNHRSHGHYLAKGGDPIRLLDEINGLPTGLNSAWCGSQLLCAPEINFHAGAIVAGLMGTAAGVALYLKRCGSEAIVVCCVGDAAADEGVFWETMNFAALMQLPLLVIVENNGYSVHVPIAERQAAPIDARASSFGMHALKVSSRQAEVVVQAVEDMVQATRCNMPCLLEVLCDRHAPHIIGMEDFRDKTNMMDPLT